MVTWAIVLETAIKWLIPALCVAIVGLVTAHFIKPFKKGTSANRQEEWDAHFEASTKPKAMGDKELGDFKKEVKDADDKILKEIGELTKSIKE